MSGLAQMYDLRDEDQAKEYLDKLGIEYRFQCYHEKLHEGCHRLGDHLEAFVKQLEKSRDVYHYNCSENKYGHSCFKLAQYCMSGRGGPVDEKEAHDLYGRGCEYGFAPACHNIGLMYYSGIGQTEKDFPKAVNYFEKGCNQGNIPSCQTLSTLFITGRDGVPKDMKKAFEFASKACTGGNMYACANVSQMYARGDGVAEDKKLAERFRQKAKTLHKDATSHERQIEFGK